LNDVHSYFFTGIDSPAPADSIPATSTKVSETLLGTNSCKHEFYKQLLGFFFYWAIPNRRTCLKFNNNIKCFWN